MGITTNDRRKKPFEGIRKYCFESRDTVIGTLSKLQSGHLQIPYTESLAERYIIVNQRSEALSSMALTAIIGNLFPEGIDDVAEIRKLVLSANKQAEDIHELFNLICYTEFKDK